MLSAAFYTQVRFGLATGSDERRNPLTVNPSFIITIRMIRKLKDILQVGSRRDTANST